MHVKPTVVIAIMTTIFPFAHLSAQLNSPRYEVAAGPALFIYQGDLSPARAGSYRTLRPGLALMGSRIFNNYFSLRAGLAFGSLRGDDAKFNTPEWKQQRNFNFSTRVTELSAVAIYNIAGTNGRNDIKTISPYVFGGVGFSFHNIKRDWSGFNAAYFGNESWVVEGLAADIDHSLPRRLFTIPLGVGIRYPINESFSIAAETGYRFTFTDYLDGFSRSAGPAKKDAFHTQLVSIIYTFRNYQGLKCPPVKL